MVKEYSISLVYHVGVNTVVARDRNKYLYSSALKTELAFFSHIYPLRRIFTPKRSPFKASINIWIILIDKLHNAVLHLTIFLEICLGVNRVRYFLDKAVRSG
jgi:hypothetical protein